MATCVECDAEFDIDEVEVGDVVSCPECGLDMEVLSRRPLELEAVTEDEEDEVAEEEENSEWE
jgi:alpha-aminoadipate carrier protein LysW